MAEVHYNFGPGNYRIDQLSDEIVAAGLPKPAYLNGSGMTGPGAPATSVDVVYAAPLTPAGVNTLNATVAAHVPAGPRRPRPLHSIFNDVLALTTQQLSNLWADCNSPVAGVSKYLTDYGVNAGPIFTMDWTAQLGPTAAGQKANAQNCIMSMYIQDNPRYAVHPPFDTSIDVPGDEPA